MAGAEVGLSNGGSDLDGILAAQQGFVTVVHDRPILQAMHALGPSVVARHRGEVVAYALTMPVQTRQLLPILEPMFVQLERLTFRGRPLPELSYYVMGQICVAQDFRGQGVFEALYAQHRAAFADRFELLVTEVSRRNGRSLRAHARTGLVELQRYRDETDEWVILGMALHA